MKKICQFLMVLIAGGIVFSSCRKNDDEPSFPTPLPGNMKWVKKMVAGPNDYFAYTYTSQKQVDSYTSKWTYSPDGPVIQTYKVTYQYEDGKVKEAISQGVANKSSFIRTISLTVQNFISQMDKNMPTTNTPSTT